MNIKQAFEKFFGEYIEWDEYLAKVGFLDEFNFQQETRRKSIKNL